MTRSQSLALTHALTGYAQGLATAQSVDGLNGDLMHLTGAPVPVNSDSFTYALFDENSSTQTVDTIIADSDPEGPTIDFGGSKITDTLQANGAASPYYRTAGMTDMQVLNSIRSAARLGTTRMLLSRLSAGITAINADAGAPTAIDSTNTATKVINLLQEQIDAVALACGGYCQINLLWGSEAFRAVANHTLVQNRVSGGAVKGNSATLTLEQIDNVIGMNTKSRLSRAVVNSAKRGQTVDNAFLLTNVVYIAAVSPTPDTLDPAAVKLFQGEGDIMSPIFWAHPSGTHERCKWLWKENVKVTNASAIKKQVITV